ncbi:MAG TPA: MlaD family protein [Burkholderiales bacterium]|jgi:phospholipid/cholesterol/gamma-HCH transport system substrate-binding protein|nr:MlaD family protein [Burkholderiales bacterium]
MESRAFALITGLFVLGISACIALWAQWLAKVPLDRTEYRVVSTVPVSGLNPEAQVRYRGMSVGRVKSIDLDRKDPRRILVGIEVNDNIPVRRSTYAQLGMEGITGIAYVHLLDDYSNTQPAEKGPDGVAEVPLRPSFIDSLSDNAEGAVRDARQLMTSLNDLMTPENRKRIAATLASLDKITANLQVASERLPVVLERTEAWLGEDNRRLARESLERVNAAAKTLPELARETQALVKDARTLVDGMGKLAGEAHGTTGSLREDTLPRYNALAESVERSAQRVGRLALQLDRDPQSALFGRKPGRPGPGEPGFQ